MATLIGTLALLSLIAALLAAPQAATAAMAGNTTFGGATAPAKPVVDDVICKTSCVDLRRATGGGTLQVTGRNLSMVSIAVMRGSEGRVRGTVEADSDSMATVRVPREARSGPVQLRDRYGSASDIHRQSRIAIDPRSALRTGSRLELVSAQTTPRRAYFFGVKAPQLNFVVGSRQPASDLRVDVVASSGAIVRSYFRRSVPRNTVQSVRWDGRDTRGRAARSGRYSFRVTASNGQVARLGRRLRRSASQSSPDPLGFTMHSFTFPVASRVTWGDGLGAGRNHQGQDLMASCGRPVLAARGGKVTYRGVMDGAAGNYLVISGRATPYDFAYMHLLRAPRLRVGQTVRTGQVIGRVGSTGRSTACHLHFEMWSSPGWYKGGSPVSPVRALKRWYRQ